MQIDDNHAFAGPKFIVFPQPKREHIRQTLLAATKVPRYGPDFYNFYGLKWSHEIGGKVYTIEMHQNKEKVWQMRVPCKSKTFLPDPTFAQCATHHPEQEYQKNSAIRPREHQF